MLAERLAAYPVELRCCERARAILPQANSATEEDWTTEYDDYILSIKVVDSLDEAIAHINRCGTHHSETIVTESYNAAERFWIAWMPLRSMSTHQRVSQMAENSDSVRRSVSVRRSSMRADRWVCTS